MDLYDIITRKIIELRFHTNQTFKGNFNYNDCIDIIDDLEAIFIVQHLQQSPDKAE